MTSAANVFEYGDKKKMAIQNSIVVDSVLPVYTSCQSKNYRVGALEIE